MSNSQNSDDLSATRRDFIKGAGAAAALMATGNYAFAQGSDIIKIGLIGCGGRGMGAAGDALQADPGVRLTAMGDVYRAPIDNGLKNLMAQPEFATKVAVKTDNQFVGLDAYQKVIDSGVDVVLLTTPPGFRPLHIKAAVAANKHIFAEKPLGTDVAGVRAALEAVKAGQGRGRCFVSGFCYRY